MKFHFLFILLLIIPLSALTAQQLERSRLIVKFEPDGEIAEKWLKAQRNGNIEEFNFIIDSNFSSPYIDDKLLFALKQKKRQNRSKSSGINSDRHLELIAVIDYASDIPPQVAARKLSRVKGVAFAEPEPENKLFAEPPNDTSFALQYYFETIHALQAWDLIDSSQKIIVGIVDTGIDKNHDDLKAKIYYNPGEQGLDSLGLDKSANGIDDDLNGYIDDFAGWDFSSAQGDNFTQPGHFHGTHVGGIIAATADNITGIAGLAPNAVLLPVKVAGDSQFSTAIINGYQGILYAAVMGARVINCSWGSSSFSEAEAEIIDEATSLGALVVAASGNDSQDAAQYPASHRNVLSVAATDNDDFAASFTNYHTSVDISAPGVDIYSTIPNNTYQFASGTSMATPVAAAVAAMAFQKYPEKSCVQIGEILKAKSDNIDSLNEFYAGKLGRGRVNAEKVLSSDATVSLSLLSHSISEEFADNELSQGETVEISFTLINYLDSAKNAVVRLNPTEVGLIDMIQDSIYVGDLAEMQVFASGAPFRFKIRQGIPLDKKLDLIFVITAADGYISRNAITLTLSPSYKTMRSNRITATFNSTGNIGYNDYPDNRQGEGVRLDSSASLMYEGSLMIALNNTTLYDCARSSSQLLKNRSFISDASFLTQKPGVISQEDGIAFFQAPQLDAANPKVKIVQNVYQFAEPELDNTIFTVYNLTNTTSQPMDSVFAGLYFDWDLVSPQRNYAWWDTLNNIGFVKYLDNDTAPIIGCIMLSDMPVNFFAMDNNGNSEANPGVYDGFSYREKLMVLSSGLKRTASALTDVSMVISGGEESLLPGATKSFAFAIIGGYSTEEIIRSADQARRKADNFSWGSNYRSHPKHNEIWGVSPNPSLGFINIKINIVEDANCDVAVFDLAGRRVLSLANNIDLRYGKHFFRYDVSVLAQGAYFIVMNSAGKSSTYPLIIQK